MKKKFLKTGWDERERERESEIAKIVKPTGQCRIVPSAGGRWVWRTSKKKKKKWKIEKKKKRMAENLNKKKKREGGTDKDIKKDKENEWKNRKK